ncbi:MAG: S9 family peptidase [Bacteroidota bacterium]
MLKPFHPLLGLVLVLMLGCQADGSEQNSEATANASTANPQSSLMLDKTDLQAPVAETTPRELTMHGHTRTDNYFWMRLTDDQKMSETPDEQTQKVLDYLNAENDYFSEMMGHTEDLQTELFEEMRGRIKEDDSSVPYRVRGYYYQTRYESGKEYPIYVRREGSLDAEEEIMLNVNEMADGYDYFRVAGTSVSLDNRYLAYGVDTLSRRIYDIYVKDLETGEMLSDVIPATTGGATWSADGQYLFYTVKEPVSLRSYRVMRHKIGTPASEDVVVFEEEDETFSVFVYSTKSEQFLVMGSYQTLSTEYRILESDNPTGEFRIFQPRERGLEYSIAHYGDDFYVRCNLDARNFRLMKTPTSATTKDNWTEVVPNRDDVLLEGMDIFNDYLVLSEREAGITQLRIMPWEGEEHYIDFPEDAYLAYTAANPEFETSTLRLGYQSMSTPGSVFEYDMGTKEMTLLKESPVLGGFNKEDYRTERVMATVRDGVEVPLSIVYHKNTPTDGSAPLLLYGYGSYGYSMEPSFSSARLSLLNRGFVYVIAHIRGGEEMGRHWYEDGKLMNKKNTFYDFIDAGKYLVENGYTSQDRLFAMGGSAGGLLMGAVVNMEPDLWAGVVAAVPFVDVISTMIDESIPLTTGEWDEWGNPITDKDAYEYMLSYSPYDQVEAVEYPPMLVTTGLHDSQVQYWEPAKWVAKMREMKTGNSPLLMHTNMEAGHGGASGRFQRLREVARDYSFLIDLAGLNS